jgi:C4-dicarboxylate-specific signal transduction histidine kinase
MSEDGEKGQPVCRVVITDITELKQAEEKLRIAYVELELRVQERTAQLSDANAALSVEMAEHKQAEEELREYMKDRPLLK